MTMGESQPKVRVTFWKAKQRDWKEIDSPLSSLKLILLCTLYITSNRSRIIKASLGFCYFRLPDWGRKYENSSVKMEYRESMRTNKRRISERKGILMRWAAV